MMRAKVLLGFLMATASLVFSSTAIAAEPPADTPDASKPVVTISKETTYLVEPLRDDGYVDYIAALNRRMSEGVTPENNALVALMKIFGPKCVDEEIRDKFFEMLGMDPLPEEGNYLVSFSDFVASLDLDEEARERAQSEELDRASEGPWSAKQCPAVAQWIARNDKRIDLAVQATRRPRYFAPMVTAHEPGMLVMTLLPTVGESRKAMRALRIRAMLRVKQGKNDAACQDLLACHRLARLVGQGPTLVDGLVAIAIEHSACLGDAALAHHGNLSENEARRYADALRQLAPMPPMVDRIDVAERYMYLDAVCHIAEKGVAGLKDLELLSSTPSSSAARSISRSLGRAAIDWDSILKRGNSWYDRLVAAARQPRGPERTRAISAVEQALEDLTSKSDDWLSLAGSFLQGKTPRDLISDRLGNIFIALFMPAVSMTLFAEERSEVMLELAEMSFALAAHRAAEGKYPRELDALVPDYLNELPSDPLGEGTYRYKPKGRGFEIYSLGKNRRDDGGVAQWDFSDEDGDDLVIRVPARSRNR